MMEPFYDFKAVKSPITQAIGFTIEHYSNPSIHEIEKHTLLFLQLVGLGIAAGTPHIEDAKQVDFLIEPSIMICDRSNRVKVFQNVSRHRGMLVIDAPKKIEGAIRCPYHIWCYATDGHLISTPV